jgi:lipopolysaccharide export system permease protein
MTIFSRYVFRQTSGALLLVLLSLTGIVWISLALRELNVVTSQGQGAFTLIKMTTLGLPSFIAVIAPFALLITSIHTLNRLNSDSEIIVLTASGATAWTITKPLVALGLLVAVCLSFVNHLAAPWSNRQLRDIIVQIRTDLLTQVIQPGRFSSPEKGLTFHIRERSLDGTLYGLIMHDARDPKAVQSYLADKGHLLENESGTFLFMTDGHILRRAGDIKTPSQIIEFDKYAVDLDSLDRRDPTESPILRARERYFSELLEPVAEDEPAPAPPPKKAGAKDSKDTKDKAKAKAKERDKGEASAGRLRSELHERFSGALYPIAFVLMAVAVVGQAQSTRQNRNVRMGVCFLVGVGLRLAGLAVNNLVTLSASAVPALYLIPLVATGVSMFLIVRGTRTMRSSTLLDRVADGVQQWASDLRQRFGQRRAAARAAAGGS